MTAATLPTMTSGLASSLRISSIWVARSIEGGEQIARAWVEIANRTPSNMTFLERAVNGRPGWWLSKTASP